MFNIIQYLLFVILPLALSVGHTDNSLLSAKFHAEFQDKSCTNCHEITSQRY